MFLFWSNVFVQGVGTAVRNVDMVIFANTTDRHFDDFLAEVTFQSTRSHATLSLAVPAEIFDTRLDAFAASEVSRVTPDKFEICSRWLWLMHWLCVTILNHRRLIFYVGGWEKELLYQNSACIDFWYRQTLI